jgi:hypothetical protein
MGQINPVKTNSKRKKDLRLATWHGRSLSRPGGLRIKINELRKYKIAIAAIQETRWNKSTPQAFTSNGHNIYTSSLANNHEFGTTFLVDSKFSHMVINVTPINERLSVTRLRRGGKGSAACSSHHVKLAMGDLNAKIGQETRKTANDRQAQPA